MGQDLTTLIPAAVEEARGASTYRVVKESGESHGGRNQYLFFLKPEATAPGVRLADLAALLTEKLDEFALRVASVLVLSGPYLAKHDVVSEHYGVIDQVARNPKASLSEQARERFHATFGRTPAEANLVGGIDYLRNHPDLDEETMARRWLEREYVKLGGGTYVEHLEDEGVFLINGFYPRMLRHFTHPDSVLVSLVLRSDTSWEDARTRFIGATNPAQAEPGSFRKVLLERQDELGIHEVSANMNGAHLSAGPLEGLVELIRFTSNLDETGKRSARDFVFGRMLLERMDEKTVQRLLLNPDVRRGESTISVFDLTEEMDSGPALEALVSVADQLGA